MKISILSCILAGAAVLTPPILCAQAPRSLFRPMDASDPNNDPSWDFWDFGSYTIYYQGKDGAIHSLPGMSLPYYTPNQATYDNSWHPDVLPADGWMLVKRDFGTPTAAPTTPYIMLYNKYRGILRVFMLNVWPTDYNQYSTTMGFNAAPSQTNYHAAMLTFSDQAHAFENDYDSQQQIITLGNMQSQLGWGSFDFTVAGYDPNLTSKPYVMLNFQVNGLNTSNLSLKGNVFGTIDQLLNNAPVSGSKNGLQTIEQAIGQGVTYYKDTGTFMSSLQTATQDPSNQNAWWLSAATQLVGAYFTGGASAYVPWIAGAAGFLQSFIGGQSKAAPMQPMKFQVNLDMKATGTITSTTQIDAPGFYVNATSSPLPSAAYPVQTIPWGVFNISQQPVVTVQAVYRAHYGPIAPDGSRPVYPVLTGYQCTIAQSPDILVNPNTGLTTQSVSVAFTDAAGGSAPSGYYAYPLQAPVTRPLVPSGLTYQLKFNVPNPSSLVKQDSTQVFQKTVPIQTVDGPEIGWFEPYWI